MECKAWTIFSAAGQDVKRFRWANVYQDYGNDQSVRVCPWAVPGGRGLLANTSKRAGLGIFRGPYRFLGPS